MNVELLGSHRSRDNGARSPGISTTRSTTLDHLDSELRKSIPLLKQMPPLPFGPATIAMVEKQYQAIEPLIDAFLTGDPKVQQAIIDAEPRCLNRFNSYADDMAYLSVREEKPSLTGKASIQPGSPRTTAQPESQAVNGSRSQNKELVGPVLAICPI